VAFVSKISRYGCNCREGFFLGLRGQDAVLPLGVVPGVHLLLHSGRHTYRGGIRSKVVGRLCGEKNASLKSGIRSKMVGGLCGEKGEKGVSLNNQIVSAIEFPTHKSLVAIPFVTIY
jgi:hypothetical protein